MSAKARAALGYLAAILIPLVLVSQWGRLSPVVQGIPAVLLLLLVALIARFCAFGPALVFSLTSSVAMWFLVLRFVTTEPTALLLRLGVYLAAAITIASITRQRSDDVREVTETYRALVELSPDAIGVADPNGTILFANSAMARLVGARDVTEVIGKKTLDFAHPEYVDLAKKRINDLASGVSAPWLEAKWIRLDGTTIHVEVAGVPVRRRGKLVFQGFIRDLTERKKAEQTIDENRRRLQALFDTAIDTTLFVDSEGRFVDANPAASALLGYTREELLDLTLADICQAADRMKMMDAFRAGLAAGTASEEVVIRRKDASTRTIECRVVANVLPNLHVEMMHDITARKEAERSLEQLSGRLLRLQDDERRRIARQLHDTTGQSLTALRLNLSRISRSPAASDPAVKEAIDESIALTEQSIAEVRTLSYVLHPPMIDEIGLIPSLRWYARGFEERTGIAVTLEVPDDLQRLPREVETAIFRIVQEALTNIQRHSGSTVARIRLERGPDNVKLEVEDEGRGIPADLRDHEDVLAASGVGIAGIRQRIRELGGRMEIRSKDQGMRMVVTIPNP
jgi:PAS domain S-box-containing protein